MKHALGFSIVELMIALTIGLLAMLAASTAMTVFESGKRNSVSSSDSMQNGYLAVFAIDSDASKAGWGLNDSWLLGCSTLMVDSRLPAGSPGYPLGSGAAQVLAPVVINSSLGAGPDEISIYSGNSATGSGSLTLTADYNGDNNPIAVSPPVPTFSPGDVFVIATDPSLAVRPNCLIGQSTNVVNAAPTQITHTSGAIAGTNYQTRFNNATGLAPLTLYSQTQGVRVFNLGPGEPAMNRGAPPSFRRWFVNNGNLMIRASDVLDTGSNVVDTVAVDNVVNLKAQYGIQAAAGGAVVWSNVVTDSDGNGVINYLDWQKVIAIRVAVVARSREVDRPTAGGNTCTTTTAQPRVFDQPAGSGTLVTVAVAGDTADWTCYRYRIFEATIPLRNIGWRPS